MSATGGPRWRLPMDNHFVVVDDRGTRRPGRGNRLLPCLGRELLAPAHVGLGLPQRDRNGLTTLVIHAYRDPSKARLLLEARKRLLLELSHGRVDALWIESGEPAEATPVLRFRHRGGNERPVE